MVASFQCLRWWVRRYLIQDLVGWAGAIAGGMIVHSIEPGPEAIVVGALVGELVFFYGWAWLRDAWQDRCERRVRSGRLKRIVGEFALPELLDLAFLQPMLLVASATVISNPMGAVLLGGAVADVIFYALAGYCCHRHAAAKSDDSSISHAASTAPAELRATA